MKSEQTKFIYPTPAGAYFFAQKKSTSWHRNALKYLFSKSKSPRLSNKILMKMFDSENLDTLKNRLDEFETLKLIQIVEQEVKAPEGDLVENLNKLLSAFSNTHKVLLSDSQGFCITHVGFPTDMLEEISVLSADIAIMHKRRALNINKNLGLTSQAWSIVDASGNSCLGFWPINIEDEVFVLAIEGVPFFNQSAIISLVWILYLRYGQK